MILLSSTYYYFLFIVLVDHFALYLHIIENSAIAVKPYLKMQLNWLFLYNSKLNNHKTKNVEVGTEIKRKICEQ